MGATNRMWDVSVVTDHLTINVKESSPFSLLDGLGTALGLSFSQIGAARRDSQSAADAEHRVELALPVESLFGVGTGGFVVGSRASA